MNETTDKIWLYLRSRYQQGAHVNILKGGRRSGKTWHILQWLGMRCVYFPRHIVSVAAMTNDQGRLGSFADMGDIAELYPALFNGVDPNTSPLEIRYPNGSKMIFKSYRRSETAKGIACDDLFINEAARMEAGEERMEILKTAESIMIDEDQAIIPFYYYVSQNLIDLDKWGGWYSNTMDYHPTKDIYLK